MLVILGPTVMAQYRGRADASELAPQFCSIRQPAKPKTPADSTHGSSIPSPSTAWKLSLWSTLVPTTGALLVGKGDDYVTADILITAGIFLGPATGYFYGHCSGRGVTGMLIRMGTAGATAGLAAVIIESSDEEGWDALGQVVLAGGIIAIGITLIAVEAIHDIHHVKFEVRDRNKKFQGSTFSITPTYFPKDKALGLAFRITL